MAYKDYEALITDMVSNPDAVATKGKDLLDRIKNDLDEHDKVVADNSAKDTKIRELQDANTKLFLSITGQNNTEPDDDRPRSLNELSALLHKED